MRVSDIGDRLSNVLRALANRLTAEENFGPEGLVGQVLTSNGNRPTDPPPSYQDIQGLISGNPTIVKEITGPQGPPGPAGPQGPEGSPGFMPTYIGPSETFTIPANRQGLYALPIVNDGSLVITGDLVMVD